MLSQEFQIIQRCMMFVAGATFNRVVVFPLPKPATDNSVAFRARQADESSSFLAPGYPVEVSWSSASAADKSPMPITAREFTLDFLCCLSQWITVVSRVDLFAITTNHVVDSLSMLKNEQLIYKKCFASSTGNCEATSAFSLLRK